MVSQNFNQLTYLDNIQSLTDVDVPKTYPSVQTAQSDKFYMLFASKPNPITNTGNRLYHRYPGRGAIYFPFFSKALRIFSGVTGSSMKSTPMAS
jgi:hypothetical protein